MAALEITFGIALFALGFGAAEFRSVPGRVGLFLCTGPRLFRLAQVDNLGGHACLVSASSLRTVSHDSVDGSDSAPTGQMTRLASKGTVMAKTTKAKSGADRARVALVTGAASGIGRATVDVLRREGWLIAAIDQNVAAVEALTQQLGPTPKVLTAAVDVTDEAAVKDIIATVVEEFGGIDGVVNSAGIAADVPALETTADMFRKILDVNVVGSFLIAKVAAEAMRKAKHGGAIVNLASVSGLRGSKGRVAYGASKGAVVTMTQVLANDLAQYGIRVNAVAPGPIETAMIQKHHTAADRALWLRYVPQNRYGKPEDVGEAIAFLLDESRASFITGEVLAVDGGFRGAGVIAGRP